MNRDEAIRLLDVIHDKNSSDEARELAYQRLKLLFELLLE